VTTILPVAKLLRWQCQCLDGSWDEQSMAEMAKICRYKLTLVGPGTDEHERGCAVLGMIDKLLAMERQQS
jgi:hypothetical protein